MSVHKPEKRKQVLDFLRDPLTCNMSTRAIARLAGVRPFAVAGHKKTVTAEGPIYMKGAIEVIEVGKLRLDPGIQSRVKMSAEVVDQYVDAIRSKASFPAIGVVFDGTDYWVWDGFHRVKAHVRARRKTILAEIRQGTRRDAVLLSVRANAEHGMMRTSDDKRRAIETLLRDDEWGQWSDSEIGRRCAVDHKTVANVRSRLSREIPKMGASRTVERGGTTYVQNTANIGRSSQSKEVSVRPDRAAPEADTAEPTNGELNGSTKARDAPRFAPEPLPLDPEAAVRLIVKHFKGEALDALIRGLAKSTETR